MHRLPVLSYRFAAIFRTAPILIFACTLIVACSLGAPAGRAQMPTEKPKGYVSDYAGVLSGRAQARLEALSSEIDQKAHAQLAVVTVKSLEGQPIEDFSIALATKWGIGNKSKKPGDQTADRGVLLIIAVADHRDRIEVGYGLEPIIPDGRAGDILRSMTPYLRNGDYDSAVALGASSIAAIIARDANVTIDASLPRPATQRRPDEQGHISPLTVIVLLLFLVPFLLFSRRGPGGFFFPGGGEGWTGGGGGGFSGGGGGFGGFSGGSFGGGGASGSW